ncbi:Maf-like protein [Neolecta irregularis DAH-3]|uniref:Maf-like protein n=1 Tax=Neolecta irregularis (strain DAH-3) TaxID=1198029 RepID=A0A1U7LWQ8_NEOID|nr:Maf-like protein [Neolecta irregularis DAH-3]|eukprot:OLL27115.1 Maf-like protein [Neolecta irregularis DAH-3]
MSAKSGLPPTEPPAYSKIVSLRVSPFTDLHGKRIILASQSPRRIELLLQMGLENVEVIPSCHPENLDQSHFTPFEYVLQTAQEKAIKVYSEEAGSENAPDLVIAADTIVLSGSIILEKPASAVEHLNMLRLLRGKEHKVFTGGIVLLDVFAYTQVAVIAPLVDAPVYPGYSLQTHLEETIVTFSSDLTDEFLRAYVESGEASSMAGGYGIQGRGALLVEKINGDYNNVVGLPLRATLRLIDNCLKEAREGLHQEAEETGLDSD